MPQILHGVLSASERILYRNTPKKRTVMCEKRGHHFAVLFVPQETAEQRENKPQSMEIEAQGAVEFSDFPAEDSPAAHPCWHRAEASLLQRPEDSNPNPTPLKQPGFISLHKPTFPAKPKVTPDHPPLAKHWAQIPAGPAAFSRCCSRQTTLEPETSLPPPPSATSRHRGWR